VAVTAGTLESLVGHDEPLALVGISADPARCRPLGALRTADQINEWVLAGLNDEPSTPPR